MKGSNWISNKIISLLEIVANIFRIYRADLSTLSNAQEYLQVHVDQTYEGEHPGGEGGVPDQGQRVPGVGVIVTLMDTLSALSPEYEVWISPRLARINLIGSVVLGQGHLHELGSVEGEGEDRHGDDVDEESLGVTHCLEEVRQVTPEQRFIVYSKL